MVYGHIHGQVPVLQLDSEGRAILLHESNCLIGATVRTWHNHSDFLTKTNEQNFSKAGLTSYHYSSTVSKVLQ